MAIEQALYLFPVTLGDTPVEAVLPSRNQELISQIRHFIVEDVRSARRFLKKVDRNRNIDELAFCPLNKHTSAQDILAYLQPLEQGQPMGVLSEAGCPAIADPGADVVALAQRKGLKVVPLVGPSSIVLSLMASGFNGQSFAFHGYLPIDGGQRAKMLRALEQRIFHRNSLSQQKDVGGYFAALQGTNQIVRGRQHHLRGGICRDAHREGLAREIARLGRYPLHLLAL